MSITTKEEAKLSSVEDATKDERARLTEKVKSRAHALGFQKVGVVRAEALTGQYAVFIDHA